MTTAPFEPGRDAGEQSIAAADAGTGAPEPAPGFGIGGEPDGEAGRDEPDEANQPDAEDTEQPGGKG
jgi:hypothetical protein